MGRRLENTLMTIGMTGAIIGGTYSTIGSVYERDATSIEEREMWRNESKTGWLITTSFLIPFALGAGIKIGRYQSLQELRREEYEEN